MRAMLGGKPTYDAPGQSAADPAQIFMRPGHLVQDSAAMLQQQSARFCGGDAPAIALQQGLTQFTPRASGPGG